MSNEGSARIGIVGGGPAGLVLARVLAEGGVASTVLERDADADARAQGGSLDLHPESGQRALAVAGLIDGFRRQARPQGEQIRILDPSGHEHVRHGEDPPGLEPDADGIVPGRPEIDRAELRAMLLASVPEGTVRWGQQVVEVAARPEGGHRVRCAGGESFDFDVLVGADGGRSLVRPLLTDVEPTPTGAVLAHAWIRDLAATPEVADFIGPGSLWCLGRDLNVGAQRGGSGDARVSVSGPAHAVPLRPGATRSDMLALLRDGWHPRIVALVSAAADDVAVHETWALPPDLTWSSRGDVTVIGDAAHVMPPVGEGANQAMLDAALLGRALLASPDDPAAAIASAEAAMFERVRPVAEQSARIEAALIAPDALQTMTQMFG